MPDWLIALLKIGGMFAVMLVGYVARRRGTLSADSVSSLSRLVVDVALPALILGQMLSTVDRDSLASGFYLPLLAVATIGVAELVGLGTSILFAAPGDRRTYVFLVAISNWIYLPLPIAESLFGAQGRLAVLLYNAGAMVVLFTLGVFTLRGGRPDAAALRELARNPGLAATIGGALLAVLVPGLRGAESLDPNGPPWRLAVGVALQALALVGSLTIPLSLVLTGAQLAGLRPGEGRPTRALAGVLASRLVLAPCATLLLGLALARAGLALPHVAADTVLLISAMPVAVSCGVFAERFGGDAALASSAIFWSTLLSAATAPGVLYLAHALSG